MLHFSTNFCFTYRLVCYVKIAWVKMDKGTYILGSPLLASHQYQSFVIVLVFFYILIDKGQQTDICIIYKGVLREFVPQFNSYHLKAFLKTTHN